MCTVMSVHYRHYVITLLHYSSRQDYEDFNSLLETTEDRPGCQCYVLKHASKSCESRREHTGAGPVFLDRGSNL